MGCADTLLNFLFFIKSLVFLEMHLIRKLLLHLEIVFTLLSWLYRIYLMLLFINAWFVLLLRL